MTHRKTKSLFAAACVALVAFTSAGCGGTVDGEAVMPGRGDLGDGTPAEQKYPNLLKECDVLTTDVLAKAVDADPRDIQSTFVGALCRWQAMSKSGGLVDITRFWFETGSLEAEKATANSLKYNVQERAIQGIPSIVMKPPDQPGACGVASDAAGVVGWWVNPQGQGGDSCTQAIKLMEMTLSVNI
ncbi:putative lipoprotein LprC [Mycolicibacterium phlei]|uniref:DUF3558 domain-containing protein n=1 Tax=Mycobacteroides chelonae TaxID=1774 RepID=UPI000618AE0C|nr:DUF3558 domain-containing protein [Mycobacteroides chelonae]VEG15560.1 putative lipoprotein LprC [Mycolicibacterium phlei]AKC38310.1 lipoprotein LprC [Mycobacteroides chelonae]ANA97551.1 hypothetical protein BB28_07040 [Mycobacteroides chelonae CCUG 47445]OLT75342.1 hypothetical protein BKG56_16550 [Mycobacteroides chelonae]ORV13002.1 hypothetical protein AWB96_16795 [Mycobacteroides chelonae]